MTELLQLIVEHLFLVSLSTSIAVVIGIPLGILLTRKEGLSKPIMGLTNILQTIPSLTLFGFLIPLVGIGPRTAIITLVVYSLLPIVRNTYTGIQGVDAAVREAGRGMGMTSFQLLRFIELPLAFPVIMTGIRIAAVIAVGTATIAAAIDAGGLGRYIFRGLRMNDNHLILMGAIPAALIALAVDFILSKKQKGLLVGLLLLPVVFLFQSTPPKIKVGAKDFTEQVILGELLAQTIEKELKIPVSRHFDLGGQIAHQAILSGEIDLYVEYSGTALTSILKMPLKTDIREEYRKRFHLAWGEPLGFNNSFALFIRGEDAKNITRISELPPSFRAGFGQDFMSREDGYRGLSNHYDITFHEIREMDPSFTYLALAEKRVDFVNGNTTDALVASYGFLPLIDDRAYFPAYDAVPVIRLETLEKFPALRNALAKLHGRITADEMRRMNYLVDVEKRPIHEVVAAFLKGLSHE